MTTRKMDHMLITGIISCFILYKYENGGSNDDALKEERAGDRPLSKEEKKMMDQSTMVSLQLTRTLTSKNMVIAGIKRK
ncbi:MAG: hypothetical protein ACJ71K_00960 [Nitrososphaeraceae archaeon]